MTISKFAVLALTVTLAGCAVAPPSSPMEQRARLAAGAELAVQQCGGYTGGYAGAQQMKQDANANIVAARKLGATDEVLAKAKKDVETGFNNAAIFTNRQEACNQLVSQLAWVSN